MKYSNRVAFSVALSTYLASVLATSDNMDKRQLDLSALSSGLSGGVGIGSSGGLTSFGSSAGLGGLPSIGSSGDSTGSGSSAGLGGLPSIGSSGGLTGSGSSAGLGGLPGTGVSSGLPSEFDFSSLLPSLGGLGTSPTESGATGDLSSLLPAPGTSSMVSGTTSKRTPIDDSLENDPALNLPEVADDLGETIGELVGTVDDLPETDSSIDDWILSDGNDEHSLERRQLLDLPETTDSLGDALGQLGNVVGDLLGSDHEAPNYFQYRQRRAATCTDVHFVFARGTTEAQGFGVVGGPLNTAFQSAFRSYSSYSVVYPAGVDQNTATGVRAATDNLQTVITTCPNTKFILGGYSQGADLMHGIKASEAIKAAVSSILLFGDPYLNFVKPSVSNLPINDAAGIFDACNSGDIVCGVANANALGTGVSHLGYAPGVTTKAATFAKQRLGAA